MKEHEYVIVERVIYKVPAPTPGVALTRFLKHPDADRKYFHAVEERTIEGPDPKTGELDTWDAYGTMVDELVQADQKPIDPAGGSLPQPRSNALSYLSPGRF